MVISTDKKILEATEQELFEYWLQRWDDIFSFPEYKQKCIDLGTKIVEEDNENNR